MDNAPAFHPLDYVSVLRRRMWWLIVPAVLVTVLGTAGVFWLPRTYQAQATIGISLPGVSNQLLKDTQRVTPEDRARNISQTLLSQDVLERVIREEGIDQHMSVAAAVQRLRSHVTVHVPDKDPTLPQGTVEQFNVLYTDAEPATTQHVTNRLADVFVEESSRKREVRAEETSSFVAQQLDASKSRLDELESQLRAAKETFMGALPEQTNANVSLVNGLQQQLESVTNAIRGDQDRLSGLDRQIDAMTASAGADTTPDGAATTTSSAALRVAAAERNLSAARAKYTDLYPEVVHLKDELAKAQADAKAEAALPASDRVASLRLDPSYRGLVAEREQVKQRIADGQRRQASIQTQIGMYRARVDAAPRVEQQMGTLQREYDLEKSQYGTLTSKLREAQMAESLERTQGGERFTVLSHANLPSTPASPNTQRLLMMVVVLGLCLGGGLAGGREYLDRSIHDSRALADLELPILGEIPRIAAQV